MGAKLDYARGRWIALLVLVWMLIPAQMFAGTTGNLTGNVTNQEGEPIKNARVVLTSPALQGTQTTTSDEQGFFRVFALPPGTYTAEVEGPGYVKTKRENIVILVDQTIRADIGLVKIGAEAAEGDVIVITEQAPIVEQGSTTVGANLSGDFLQQVPTGRRISTVLQLTPGASADLRGTSFLGASSPENAVVIDGLNTTGIDLGEISTNLPVEFIDQLEVKTAGYGAEYGRSTGAFINTILKQGGNEFHGDVFVYIEPPIQGVPEPTVYAAQNGNPLYRTDVTNLDMDVGFDVGGYIIKDKLWFFAGFMPRVRQELVTREFGNDKREYDANTFTGYYVGKLTYRISEDHNVSLTVLGNPTNFSGPTGTATDSASLIRGQEATYMFKSWLISQMDTSLRWNSKLKNDTINIEFLLGHHRETEFQTPYGERDATNPYSGTEGFSKWSNLQYRGAVGADPGLSELGTSYDAPDCGGGPGSCIMYDQPVGGFGFLEDAIRTRTTATLRVTHYLNNLMGNHKFLWGGDFEFVQFANTRAYTTRNLTRVTGYPRERYFATAGADQADCEAQWPARSDGTPVLYKALPVKLYDEAGNEYQDGVACLLHMFPAVTNNLNASSFVQESWSILDNLTLNLGLRWEMQQLRAPRTPEGGLGLVNLGIYNNWAPRLGFIFDPTNEGRSKIFGSYGRYYESIPMDINDRAFSFEGLAYVYGGEDNPLNMLTNFGLADYPNPLILGGTTTPIEVDLKSQYHDEFLLGVEYELSHNLALSARYINRRLGSIIEDISPDDGNNYIIANPGPPKEGGTEYYDPVTENVFAIYETDPTNEGKCRVRYVDETGADVDVIDNLNCFVEATRAFQGVELTARKNFSDGWTMLASYMLSWSYGNYPGLFTPENGQIDPNITSQFDLPDLLTNRTGFLPQDRRHLLKLHGAYNWDFGLRTGLGMFIQSGTPYSHLGAHEVYDQSEAFLTPRGSAGRTPATASVDGNIEYFLPLGEQRSLSFQVEAFNMFNFQNPIRVDQDYTFAYAYQPQEGQTIDQALCEYDGSLDSDGVIDRIDGQIAYCNEMANPNFGQPIAFQSPFSLRLGVKFTF